MRYINDRPVHIYGDSHTAGYESDHDAILGRDCFKEKKDLITQFGLHQAIYYWNQKMSRATKMPVFNFAHRQLPESWASLFHPKARIVTWPALSNDFLHLTIKMDFLQGRLKSHDHVYLPVLRPTRIFKLTDEGRYDFTNEDLDGNAGGYSDNHYATVWAMEISAIMDFLERKQISYSFIRCFDIFAEAPKDDIHVIKLNPESPYTQFFNDIHRQVLVKSPSKCLADFGSRLGFWHTDREGHFLFSKYLKNSS